MGNLHCALWRKGSWAEGMCSTSSQGFTNDVKKLMFWNVSSHLDNPDSKPGSCSQDIAVGRRSYSQQIFPIFILKDSVSDPVDLGFKAPVEYFEEVTLIKIWILCFSIHAQNTFHKTFQVHSFFQKSTFRHLDVFWVFRISVSILSWLIFSIYYFLLNLLGKNVIILHGLLQRSNRKWQILRMHTEFREQ